MPKSNKPKGWYIYERVATFPAEELQGKVPPSDAAPVTARYECLNNAWHDRFIVQPRVAGTYDEVDRKGRVQRVMPVQFEELFPEPDPERVYCVECFANARAVVVKDSQRPLVTCPACYANQCEVDPDGSWRCAACSETDESYGQKIPTAPVVKGQ